LNVARVLRIGGALALFVAGLVHLDLYFGGYRSAGDVPAFGRTVLLNAIAFGIVAAAVAVRTESFVRLAGIAVAAGTLAAFFTTHNGHPLLGFEAGGLDPAPQATVALIAEIAAIVLLVATFLPALAEPRESSGVGSLIVAGVVAAVVFVGFGWYWADKYDTTVDAAGPNAVTIADFAFTPPALSVALGTTVTWTNADGINHTVFATDRSFSSGTLGGGKAFEFTFDTAGQYDYICTIHTEMAGMITVTP
jgi:plastocyanin